MTSRAMRGWGAREIFFNVLLTHVLCVIVGAPIIDRAVSTLLYSMLFVALGGRPVPLFFSTAPQEEDAAAEAYFQAKQEQQQHQEEQQEGRVNNGRCVDEVAENDQNDGDLTHHTTTDGRNKQSSSADDEEHDAGQDVPFRIRPMSSYELCTMFMAIVSWVGGIMAPLDWDVWYQEWPIPSAVLVVLARVVLWLFLDDMRGYATLPPPMLLGETTTTGTSSHHVKAE